MSPAAIIESAAADGVRLTLSASGRLCAKGAQSDIDRWLPAIRPNKAEIILLLRAGADGWLVEDWRIFYDERVAIAEFNGGLKGVEAELCAFKCCFAEWLVRNAVYSSPDRCFGCGGSEHVYDPLLPVGIGGAGQVWLHSCCRPAWYSGRKTEAIAALAAMGIVAPADFSEDFRKEEQMPAMGTPLS
jgi:hypothetical protein